MTSPTTSTSTVPPNNLEKPQNDQHHHDHDDDEEHEEHDDHDEHDDEDDHDFDDSDEEHDDQKKKRAVLKKKRSNLEVVKEDQLIPGDITDFKKKKSIEWSKYFGIDRRKKSVGWPRKIHYATQSKRDQNIEYPLHNFRNHDDNTNEQYNNYNNNKEFNEDNLQHMNDKLKTIENMIIDETLKYTGAHEGITNPEEIRQLKDHVVSRLATAYSLEKMRRALEKLKQSVDQERHLQNNEIEPVKEDKEKRVAIKKENPEFE